MPIDITEKEEKVTEDTVLNKEEQEKKEANFDIDVEKAVLENMGNFKNIVDDTFDLLEYKINNLNEELKKFEDKKYSKEYKDEKKLEKDLKERLVREEALEVIDKLEEGYLKRVCLANENIISSNEYQTRLSNFIKLFELSKGDISKEYYNFILEARDSVALRVLSKAFKNQSMLNESYKVDPDIQKQILLKKTIFIKAVIENKNGIYSNIKREDILRTLQ